VRLLQPATAEPAAGDRVAIEIISYDDDGSVLLEGRSKKPPPVARRVQVYLDNAPLQTVEIAEDGSWRTPLPKVESGVYTLRVDQVDEAGAVVSRFETPFKREDPAELARFAPSAGAGEVSAAVITVQPGFTLWGIANDRYGLGLRYVQVFEANRDQIRDPDLIYPGQVFKLPPVAP
jgi:nucleoid-associated protein YgaU